MFPERVPTPPCSTHRVARFGAKLLDTERITRIDEAMRDSYSLHLIIFPTCNALDLNTLPSIGPRQTRVFLIRIQR
jgi:hypothetical protein